MYIKKINPDSILESILNQSTSDVYYYEMIKHLVLLVEVGYKPFKTDLKQNESTCDQTN